MKKCTKCGEVKLLEDYHKLKAAKDGRRTYCKECAVQDARCWQLKNNEKVVERAREYRKSNLEKTRKHSLNYYRRNKQARMDYKVSYNHKKRQIDPLFALSETLRSSITEAFKRKGYSKPTKTEKILGCSFGYFKEYIESLFEPWMSWENKGLYNGMPNTGWDIDHIVPISTAKSADDIIMLNHHTNLKPLCSFVNRNIKRDNLDF